MNTHTPYIKFLFTLIFSLICIWATPLWAQRNVAQLEQLVKQQPPNKSKVDNFNRLAKLLVNKQPKKAIAYADEAIKIAFKVHHVRGLAMAYANQGQAWVNIGNDKDNSLPDYEKASKLYLKAFEFYKGLHEKGIIKRSEILEFLEGGVITVYQDLADIYYSEKNDYKQAAKAYRLLSVKFEEYAMAVRDFGMDKVMKRLKNEELKEQLLKQDLEEQLLKSELLKEELTKKELATQLAQKKAKIAKDSIHKIQLKDSLEISKQKRAREKATQESKLKAAQLKQQKILFFASLGCILLGVALVFVLLRDTRKQKALNNELTQQKNELSSKNQAIEQKNREIAANRDEIQDKNTQITESINYAQRIQAAMLPSIQRIQTALPRSFVYYKPRDIVSGDFYWFAELPTVASSSPEFVMAALDCTGHGVPGAFMSMVGNSLLNEIVTQKGISAPNAILTELNRSIRVQLQQKESRNQDGMDGCICKVSPHKKTIEFAGANNPLYYVQDNELHTIKGDRFGVGGHGDEMERNYTLHTLEITQATTFYLSSDGYRDQLGGPKDKKFMSKKFKALLQQITPLAVTEQTALLDKTLNEWMDYPCKYEPVREQTDDILVVGFSL